MISKFKTEILIGSLLLMTLAVILLNQFIVRSCAISAENAARVGCADDREVGGTSEAAAGIHGDIFRFFYRVDGDSNANTYSLISIVPGEDFPKDLSWADRIEITAKTNRPEGEQMTFYVKNFEPDVSVDGDTTSLKYNEALLLLSNKYETITLHRNDFLVPLWWQKRYNVQGDTAKPTFNNVKYFEFNADTNGQGEIYIASVRCVGNWINSATLNQVLLWMWMGGALVVIMFRMLRLKKRLDDKIVSTSQLLEQNNLLITESATYHELARRDPLTGLFNRYGLEAELNAMTKKNGSGYAMLLFDLDKFKEINDNLGHSYGDRVLFDVATIVRAKLGEKDIAARWGGDEFLVILFNRNVKQASDFAEEVRQSILASDLIYSCSFGICEAEADSNFEATFSKVDSAMYESKDSGRNKITSYRAKGGRRASDEVNAVVPEITLLPNDLPTGGFHIFE